MIGFLRKINFENLNEFSNVIFYFLNLNKE